MSKARCDAGRKGGFAPRWERSDIESMVTLYLEGTSNRDMAILLNLWIRLGRVASRWDIG